MLCRGFTTTTGWGDAPPIVYLRVHTHVNNPFILQIFHSVSHITKNV